MDGNTWWAPSVPESGLKYLTVFVRLNCDLVLGPMIKMSLFGFRETRNGQVMTMFPNSVRQPRTLWRNVLAFLTKSVSFRLQNVDQEG
jgi:hypothetical protein